MATFWQQYNIHIKTKSYQTSSPIALLLQTTRASDMMFWVQKMNSVRNRATEIVNADIIYKV